MLRPLFAMCLCMLLGAAPSAAQDAPARPDLFVRLHDVAPTIQQDVRYYGDFNFIGRPITGYEAPVCWLTRPAAELLRSSATTLHQPSCLHR